MTMNLNQENELKVVPLIADDSRVMPLEECGFATALANLPRAQEDRVEGFLLDPNGKTHPIDLKDLMSIIFGGQLAQALRSQAVDLEGFAGNPAFGEIEDFDPSHVTAEEKAAVTKPAKIKSNSELLVEGFLEQEDHGLLYMGTTTVAFGRQGNFIMVTAVHLGKKDKFNRKAGRELAVNRFVDDLGIRVKYNPAFGTVRRQVSDQFWNVLYSERGENQ